ncbi:MAG: hypothetical protein HOC74_09115 [Gemmatimonadetes bacterium]|jgi:hypothetical protein|nr:hypothetical protein [Gemmatimonadota bacterium]
MNEIRIGLAQVRQTDDLKANGDTILMEGSAELLFADTVRREEFASALPEESGAP